MRNQEAEITDQYYVTTKKNIEYSVMYQMAAVCVRKGTYSSIAEDPDEYYGEYRYSLVDIYSVEAYDPKTDESWELTNIPPWIYKEVQDEIDSYN